MVFFWSAEREPDSATEREVLDYISEGKVDQLPLTQDFVNYVNVKGCNVPIEVMTLLSIRMDPSDSSRHSVRASKLTWASHPRVRDDFTNIHARYQRVKAQGIRFPKEDAETVKTLNAIYESTTPEEEEQIVNSIQRGKLQELVRRSEWDDRVKAQKIMRELLGASGSSKGVNGTTEPIMPYPPPSVPHPGEAEAATDSGAASAAQEHPRTDTQKLALKSDSEELVAHAVPIETMSRPDLALPTEVDTDVVSSADAAPFSQDTAARDEFLEYTTWPPEPRLVPLTNEDPDSLDPDNSTNEWLQ
ncbi:hypothetical protein MVES1_003695 [Malassezia vespertilionis]|uniref:Uncharacterized protein n=1 Tax=Malassezia vespertilionis TaxID=2020962 RepID=A0A2N1J8I3_9BASI|nr:uncharacterized protein MVES1_003695 [Malassezia vespertilionis]PKI82863.1 hypothetical protein MVES_003257 [Malassezia vespertilionis]WFD08323.1 hypothetical protein MVES1_003695 [Malassezia vespertilionis]